MSGNGENRKVSLDEVDRIAELARLSPSGEERERLTVEMNRIIKYVGQLDELDTQSVEPLHHVLDMHNVLREDEPRPSLPVEVALKNAPGRKDDYFLVPRVIKKK